MNIASHVRLSTHIKEWGRTNKGTKYWWRFWWSVKSTRPSLHYHMFAVAQKWWTFNYILQIPISIINKNAASILQNSDCVCQESIQWSFGTMTKWNYKVRLVSGLPSQREPQSMKLVTTRIFFFGMQSSLHSLNRKRCDPVLRKNTLVIWNGWVLLLNNPLRVARYLF